MVRVDKRPVNYFVINYGTKCIKKGRTKFGTFGL